MTGPKHPNLRSTPTTLPVFMPGVIPAWADAAVCTEVFPDTMFPDDKDDEAIAAAKGICAMCTVTAECLSLALANREKFGVWGGMTADERARLIRSGDSARWRANRDARKDGAA